MYFYLAEAYVFARRFYLQPYNAVNPNAAWEFDITKDFPYCYIDYIKHEKSLKSLRQIFGYAWFVYSCVCFSQFSKPNSTIVWDDIKRISYDSANSFVPQIVAQGDTIHLIWYNIFFNALPDSSGGGIQYSRSTDGGVTFSPQRTLVPYDSGAYRMYLTSSGKYVFLTYWALVQPSPSPYWMVAVMRSTDAGITWSSRKVIGDYIPYAVTAKDSHLYIYAGLIENNKHFNMMLLSHDYGVTWDTVRLQLPRGPNIARMALTANALHLIRTIGISGYEEVFYNRSTDFGYTWSVAETLSTNDGQNGQNPRFVSEGNSLFTVWNDQKYGGNFSGTILMRRSTDEGITWQTEQIVSQLNTAQFCDIGVYNNLVAVVWDNEDDSLGAIRFSISEDRGNSFSSIEKISPDEYHSHDPTVIISDKLIHTAWWNQHDYEVYYRKGVYQLTIVRVDSKTPFDYDLSQNYPNPFNPTTTINFALPKAGNVVLKVYDALGHEVATLVNIHQEIGRYSVKFDASKLSSGMYIYKLTSGSFTEVKKMILIK